MADKNKQQNNTPERRYFDNPVSLVTRSDGEDSRIIRGYFAVFNKLSKTLGYFREKIDRNAFDDIDFANEDIVALFNHNYDQIVGRTIGDPKMTLGVDDTGAWYEFEIPNTTIGNDLLENVKRKLVQHSSFSWPRWTVEDVWDEDPELGDIRTIKKFTRILDVAPVVNPAYSDTTSDARNYDGAKKSYEAWKNDKRNEDEQTEGTSLRVKTAKRYLEIERMRGK